MDAWISFWKYACLIGFGLFYLLVAIVIPLGGRDLLRLFRRLETRGAAAPGALDWDGRYVTVGFAGGAPPVFKGNHLLIKNRAAMGMVLAYYRRRRPDALARSAARIFAALARLGGLLHQATAQGDQLQAVEEAERAGEVDEAIARWRQLDALEYDPDLTAEKLAELTRRRDEGPEQGAPAQPQAAEEKTVAEPEDAAVEDEAEPSESAAPESGETPPARPDFSGAGAGSTGHTREIATLRALGFGSVSVVGSVLIEAMLLAAAGAVLHGEEHVEREPTVVGRASSGGLVGRDGRVVAEPGAQLRGDAGGFANMARRVCA